MMEVKEQKYKMINNFITMDNETRKSVERRLITRNVYMFNIWKCFTITPVSLNLNFQRVRKKKTYENSFLFLDNYNLYDVLCAAWILSIKKST